MGLILLQLSLFLNGKNNICLKKLRKTSGFIVQLSLTKASVSGLLQPISVFGLLFPSSALF